VLAIPKPPKAAIMSNSYIVIKISIALLKR
jgi:hypothetical protein